MLGRLWNAVKSTAKSAVEVVKKTKDYVVEKASDAKDFVVDKAKKAVKKVKKVASKAWNAVTGKDKFEEAEALYKQITERYEKHSKKYKKELNRKTNLIANEVKKINGYKNEIYSQQFPEFIKQANRLHNVTVAGTYFEELFDNKLLDIKNLSGVRDREDLFTIDFNALSFKEVALSIVTFGWSTRKKAKETLSQVRDEEARVNEEIAKMDAQLKKLDIIISSIGNVSEYFSVLIRSYGLLLKRFTYGINTQSIQQASADPHATENRLDFRLLPIKHIEEFQALFNLSVVLKQMSQLSYVSSQGNLKKNDCDTAKELHKQFFELKAA